MYKFEVLPPQTADLDTHGLGAQKALARRLDDRWPAFQCGLEESPGSTERRYRLTAGGRGSERKPFQGKCHRKQTTWVSTQARVKRCGKSAPRPGQPGRQGKPYREQGRIGVLVLGLAPGTGVFRPATRVGRARRAVRPVPEEWSSRRRKPLDRTRLTGRLAQMIDHGERALSNALISAMGSCPTAWWRICSP